MPRQRKRPQPGRKARDVSSFVPVVWAVPEAPCSCGAPRIIVQHRCRRLQLLDSKLLITQKDRVCTNPECPERETIVRPTPPESRLVLKGTEYGLDVIAYVGERHIHGQRSFAEIHGELTKKGHGVQISERHVPNLFRLYLAIIGARNLDCQAVRARLEAQGRLILSVDAVKLDDVSPPLYVVREVLSEEILLAERIEKADTENLTRFLEQVKAIGIPVAGIVSDKERALVPAIAAAFPGVPHQYCQTHYFNNLVKPMESDLTKLNTEVEKIAKEVRDFEKRLDKAEAATPKERELVRKMCRGVHAFSRKRGDKLVDPSAVKRFEGLSRLADVAEKANLKEGTWPLLATLLTLLGCLAPLRELAYRLARQVKIVREIAHLLGQDVTGKTVQRRLKAYLTKLEREAPQRGRGAARGRFHDHVIAVTDRFWKGLFACYDVDGLPNNNNELESFFRALKWHERRTRGKASTAGGILESLAPQLVLLWPEIQRRPDVQAILADLSPEQLQRARDVIHEVAEPARERRSLVRDPDTQLKNALAAWYDA